VSAVRLARRPSEPLLLVAPFALFVVLTFCNTPDDPLITMRYAANLLDGQGAVFNAGERVEGFSSPLHLAVALVVELLPLESVLLPLKLASLGFGLLALREAGRLVRAARLDAGTTALGFFLAGASWPLASAASDGLETTLACWLLTALVVRLVGGRAFERPLAAAGFAGAALLARPEAIAIVVALAAAALALDRRATAARRAVWAGGGLAVFAAWLAVRWLYYGALLPNTYWAKVAPFDLHRLELGASYVVHALLPYAHGVSQGSLAGGWNAWSLASDALLVVLVAVLLAGAVATLCRRRTLVYALFAAAVQVAFAVRVGGDWMVGGRFLAPVAPSLVLVELVGFAALADAARGAPAVRRGLALLLVAAALLPLGSTSWPLWRCAGRCDDRSLLSAGPYTLSSGWITGAELLDCAAPGALVAYNQLGWAGYARRDLRFVDGVGLVDREIARRAPAQYRQQLGIAHPDWMRTDSFLGRILLRRQPAWIVDWQTPPQESALGGRYRRVETRGTFTLYRRSDVACRAAE
jgi:hypothetical protein